MQRVLDRPSTLPVQRSIRGTLLGSLHVPSQYKLALRNIDGTRSILSDPINKNLMLTRATTSTARTFEETLGKGTVSEHADDIVSCQPPSKRIAPWSLRFGAVDTLHESCHILSALHHCLLGKHLPLWHLRHLQHSQALSSTPTKVERVLFANCPVTFQNISSSALSCRHKIRMYGIHHHHHTG